MSVSMIWPIALVVLANIIYQVCAKIAPKGMNTMAMTVKTASESRAAAWTTTAT